MTIEEVIEESKKKALGNLEEEYNKLNDTTNGQYERLINLIFKRNISFEKILDDMYYVRDDKGYLSRDGIRTEIPVYNTLRMIIDNWHLNSEKYLNGMLSWIESLYEMYLDRETVV